MQGEWVSQTALTHCVVFLRPYLRLDQLPKYLSATKMRLGAGLVKEIVDIPCGPIPDSPGEREMPTPVKAPKLSFVL
jgi:hypothetical protein